MHLLWAYEHDFIAISPFLYERIGTLCRHPCWSLCKQRIAGWRSGRSEGNSKSLSAGYVPTDLLILTQRTSRPVPGWFCWSVPRGAQHFIRCAVCRSQHRGMGSRPLRMKVPHQTQSWRTCLPGQPLASGWRPTKTDWFLGAGRGSQPRHAFLPGGAWGADEVVDGPFKARSRSSSSSILTTLGSGVARGYAGIPQVERAIAVHLCPRNAATWRNRPRLPSKAWRNRPRLPSKACKLTAALAAKAYCAAGQAASALHVMAILHSDTVKGFAQQFSAVQQQIEAIQHILPRHDAPSTAAPGAKPQTARRRGHPPASSRAALPQAESIPRPARRASRRRAAPPASQPGPSHPGSRRSGPGTGNPERLEFALSQGTARTAPLLPPVEGWEENLPFLYPLSQGPSSREEAGVLQPLLPRTQETWWPSTNPRPIPTVSGYCDQENPESVGGWDHHTGLWVLWPPVTYGGQSALD